jgi:2-dehydro-3-deoxyphosphogluconate aldolase/(4S)-4-hydroxy-2-oxoglutarate aldolase
MTRQEISKRIEDTGIIPIVRAPSAEVAATAARAILAAGVDVLEITMTVPNATDLMRQLRKEIGTDVLLGAGTVLDAQGAQACIDAGAEFIVAPGLDLDTIRAAHAAGKPCMPGALTPTEVITAWKAGADMVKIFPCSALGGASYLRALKAPLPQVKLLPTGGVDATTAADFIRAGAAALGVGAAVVDLKLLAKEGPAAVTAKCKQLVEVVKAARAARG